MKQKNRTLLKIFHYMKTYVFLLALSVLLAVAVVALTLYFPILTGNAVDTIVAKGKVDFTALKGILIKAALVVAATALLQWVLNMVNNAMTYRVVRDIRKDAFTNLEKLPLSYIDSHPHGDIVSRLIADVDTFADGLLMGTTQLFTGIATILGCIIFMLTIDWRVTLIVLLGTPLSLVFATFIAKGTHKMFKLQSETRGLQTSLINETINNQKVVLAFGQEEKVEKRFDEINKQLQNYSLRATFFSSLVNPSTRFVYTVIYIGVGMFGAFLAIGGGISVGQLSCFLGYVNTYTKPFNEISGVITEMQNALACAARIFEIIEAKPEEEEPADAVELTDVSGAVKAEQVYFSYEADKRLIEDLNLDVMPGQRIAIVGPTGCGKTTLINLLMRFYEPNRGSFTVSKIPATGIRKKSLRTNYGMVLQETWLKAGTIRENIILGKPDATEEEILEAAKASHAYNFIKRLPDGFDTVLEENGENLSAGQRQLLCITRVMLCLPPMLILDEATSSIDTRTEIRIQKAFATMMQGRTSFIVAHRLSTIRDADYILVMKDGRIIEQGKHESLLAQKGFYYDLYNAQFAN